MRINTGYVKVGETAKNLMKDVLDSSRISCGKYVNQFEKIYAKKHNVKYAITVGSGTEADLIALLVLKETGVLKDGDKVLCPATVFVSVANAIVYAGLTPIFVDGDPFNMDLDEVKKTIDELDIKAIIAVHFSGLPLDMEKLKVIAGSIPIIEDCACAHGAIANNKITGSIGLMSTWSLYVAHIVTAGGGGVIGTNDAKLAEMAYSLRAYGRSCTCQPCIININGGICTKRFKNGVDTRFSYNRIGLHSRMTEMEAVIGIDQMEIYDEIINTRVANFTYLKDMLSDYIPKYFTTFPFTSKDGFKISPISFPVILADNIDRRRVVSYLEKVGIETRNLFCCIPKEPAYKEICAERSDKEYKNASIIDKKGFYVGIHQGLTKDDLDFLIESIINALKEA